MEIPTKSPRLKHETLASAAVISSGVHDRRSTVPPAGQFAVAVGRVFVTKRFVIVGAVLVVCTVAPAFSQPRATAADCKQECKRVVYLFTDKEVPDPTSAGTKKRIPYVIKSITNGAGTDVTNAKSMQEYVRGTLLPDLLKNKNNIGAVVETPCKEGCDCSVTKIPAFTETSALARIDPGLLARSGPRRSSVACARQGQARSLVTFGDP
jgi:hypothetical protein